MWFAGVAVVWFAGGGVAPLHGVVRDVNPQVRLRLEAALADLAQERHGFGVGPQKGNVKSNRNQPESCDRHSPDTR